MSSTSSVCSSNDADFIIDSRIPSAMRRDVERFSVFVGRLRAALDVNTTVPDGESMCVSVHAALEMVSESMRDLFKYSQFKTNQVILPSLQLVQSVKDLKFDSSLVDTTHVHQIIDQLESAVLNTIINRHVISPQSTRFSTVGRRQKQSSSEVYSSSKSKTLQRRHSAYHTDNDANDDVHVQPSVHIMEIDKVLISREDGLDIAFERTKAWSTYCKDLLAYIRARLQLEQDHARRVFSLVDASRRDIGKPWLGLREVWEDSFDCETSLMARTRETVDTLKDRVVEALETRRKEHELVRSNLKVEWSKIIKVVHDCEEAFEKSRSNLKIREENLRKAREQCMRTESIGVTTNDMLRRRREMDKKKRSEEDAIAKREEAEKQMSILASELRRKRKEMEVTKERIIEKLRELIFQCDQTTKACTSHYFKSLAALWVKLPGSYQQLSDATREFEPGSAYMTFLQHLPDRAASTNSLLRSDRSVDEGVSCDGSSVASLRRNALNPDDEGTIPDTKRHKKTSTAGRLFDSTDLSDSAHTHCVQRTVQPSKCAHCDRLSIVFTVQCIDCQQQWHRSCFPKTSISCGQTLRASADRRMSIFGVSLKGHLDMQKRSIPLILESTIHELQKRGMRVKGIYRTCGVKSKIEEICELFERCTSEEQIDLSNVHPMNLASVIKLYLRKLPEPLLTFDLYNEFARIGSAKLDNDESCYENLRCLIHRLPSQNYETLKYFLLHLNRVTWFQESNLMCCSNLSTVVAPSLIWPPPFDSTAVDHSVYLQQAQHTNSAVLMLIKNAYRIFSVDRDDDWRCFFEKYQIDEPPKEVIDDDGGNESEDEHDDEDDEEEEEDGLVDDEPMFIPQPPTPDLLKNTRKSQEKCAPSSITTGSISDPWQSSPEEKPRRNDQRKKMKDKRRSYTTSILISPTVSRSNGHPTTLNNNNTDKQKPILENTICSGEVTLEISKGQFFVDRKRDGRQLVRRQSNKEYSSFNKDVDKYGAEAGNIISVHNVGDLFPGTDHDVSYV
ncbi:unnamed protein product [Auanema sp. JU1783]|nr:unnamed protein product [Auanema sp. JU1783]